MIRSDELQPTGAVWHHPPMAFSSPILGEANPSPGALPAGQRMQMPSNSSPLEVSHGLIRPDTEEQGPIEEFGLAQLQPIKPFTLHMPFLHVMLSYRVETEGMRGNQLVRDIYEKLHALSLNEQVIPMTGLSIWPPFFAPPPAPNVPHRVKVFWDIKCLVSVFLFPPCLVLSCLVLSCLVLQCLARKRQSRLPAVGSSSCLLVSVLSQDEVHLGNLTQCLKLFCNSRTQP